MSFRDNIKNRIKQIREHEIEIIEEFPVKNNFSKKRYRKYSISCLFIDIADYTKICNDNDDKSTGKLIRTFHEGILDIIENYELKHIQIQGDGIYGILPTKTKNSNGAQKIFDCALDINGYLKNYWKEAEYRISIFMKEELMIIVGKNNNINNTRVVVFAGGAINGAKKQMTNNKKNCILLDDTFVENNSKILWDDDKNESYISGTTNLGTQYSERFKDGWD